MARHAALSSLLLALLGCSGESLVPEREPYAEVPPLSEALGSSIAEPGRVRLFVGQDVVSIADYARDVGPVPGATSYTSLRRLEGVTEEEDSGGGPMHLDALAESYPGAPLAIGLYLVDDLQAVLAGERDAAIVRLGQRLKTYDVPVLVRIGYEFDIEWSHYPSEPFKAAYVKIGEMLRREAPRVELVWHSSALCDVGLRAREAYYPGDEYVDYVAASVFAQSECAFQPVLELVGFARQHHKPFFIAESTPQGFDLGDSTFSERGHEREDVAETASIEQWFEPFFDFIHQHTDVVRGVSYINSDWDTQRQWAPPYANGYFGDSRVQASEAVKSRWLSELSDPVWIAGN